MSVMAHFIEPPVTLLDHEKHIRDLYAKDVGFEPKAIFNILTPFRMDLEAEKVALEMAISKTKSNDFSRSQPLKRNKRKRNNLLQNMTKQEYKDVESTLSLLSQSLLYLKQKKPELFRDIPGANLVKENNRQVRCLIQNIESNARELQCQLEGENSDETFSKVFTIKGNS